MFEDIMGFIFIVGTIVWCLIGVGSAFINLILQLLGS